jgi:hypothetical protein
MADALVKAARIVGDAENNLKKLLAETATGGDYSLVVRLAGWAHRLSDLLSEIVKAAPAGTASSDLSIPDAGKHQPLQSSPVLQKTRRASEYPKFRRDADTLVKIGWSKTQKSEYEHKAPVGVLTDLVAAISAFAGRKIPFAMETIMPLKSPRDGGAYPDYQVYLCLAWLRAQHLVIQHGRQGYTITPKIDLISKTRELFARLPEQ